MYIAYIPKSIYQESYLLPTDFILARFYSKLERNIAKLAKTNIEVSLKKTIHTLTPIIYFRKCAV